MMVSKPWLADEVTIDWARVAARPNEIEGTSGDDDLVGTDGRDDFLMYYGGNDHVQGLAGDDRFFFGDTLNLRDRIDGGDGVDTVLLANPPAPPSEPGPHIVISDKMFTSVETLKLVGSSNFDLEFQDGLGDLKITGNGRGLIVDASTLTSSSLKINNRGLGFDHIVGGSGDDWIYASGSPDRISGGLGSDRFVYKFASESSLIDGVDLITDFSAGDVIKLQNIIDSGGFHLGMTPDRVGDVTFDYNEARDRTELSIFIDGDSQPDMTIYLSGDLQLKVVHDTSIILA